MHYAPGMADAARGSPTWTRAVQSERTINASRRFAAAASRIACRARSPERKHRITRARQHDPLNGERTRNVGGETVDGACTQHIGDVALSAFEHRNTKRACEIAGERR